MSEITDFYLSWDGCGAFGANGRVLRENEPPIFQPTDISGCAMWFDATDNLSVDANEFGEVLSWSNKGTIGGQFDISGSAAVLYGTTFVNGLNTVSFTSNAFMEGSFQLNFQARTLFVVTKETSVAQGQPSPWLTSDTSGGMETFSQHDVTTTYYIGKHNVVFPELAAESPTDYNGYPALFTFVNSVDLSDNYVGVNRQAISITYNTIASGYNTSNIKYFLGDYLNGSSVGVSQDICELILYNTALSVADRDQVEGYLARRWGIQEPPPPPFAPTDISGLYVWMDANNQSTVTTNVSSQVLTWSNLGLASNVFSNDSNWASYIQDSNSNYVIAMPTETSLITYAALPYNTRTSFSVFENVSDLTTLTYPYENIWSCGTSGGVQLGVAYDSNTTSTTMNLCQQGYNCPSIADISLPIGGYNLAIWGTDSNTTASTIAYFNGGSNINYGTDLGNLFNTNPIYYGMGSPVHDSPAYRIAEILEYDSILTTAQLSTVANYLVTKWAISSFTTLL